ncbi:MAG: TlpA family protein disulfide reductase [Pseudomonadota bacterium]|nr:MAG: TlpA family protein disulfide reductase [Pseudomonadota bacterium]
MTARRTLLTRRSSIRVVFAVIVALAAALVIWDLSRQQARQVPDLELSLLDGGRVNLTAMRGRPLLVTFWATTCPPCVEELPDLVALYRELAPQGLQMVAIAMPYDPPMYVQAFQDKHHLPYPIALDVEGRAVRAFEGVSLIPAAYLIGPDGRIEYTQVGKLDTDKVRQIVARLFPIASLPS